MKRNKLNMHQIYILSDLQMECSGFGYTPADTLKLQNSYEKQILSYPEQIVVFNRGNCLDKAKGFKSMFLNLLLLYQKFK